MLIGKGDLRVYKDWGPADEGDFLRFRVRLVVKPRDDLDSPFKVWRSVIATSDRPVKGIGAVVMTRCRTDLRIRTSVRAWWRDSTDDPWHTLWGPAPLRSGPVWFNRCG